MLFGRNLRGRRLSSRDIETILDQALPGGSRVQKELM
jgi:hypothetical protein